MLKTALTCIISTVSYLLLAQHVEFAKQIVASLTDSAMHGRGYVNEGDKKAAELIASEFEKAGLLPLDASYFQNFTLPMNTFPDTLKVTIDNKALKPGEDFVVSAFSPIVNGTFSLVPIHADSIDGDSLSKLSDNQNLDDKVVITDAAPGQLNISNSGVRGIVYIKPGTPGWHVSDGMEVREYFEIVASKEKIPDKARQISVKINSRFIEQYPTQNVVAYVEGTLQPDTCLIFGAHYDHLGRMGSQTYFPGANDNSSGVAMLLDLAHYYGKPENQPNYSMVFIAFAAEEAGLLGSSYFVSNPLIPLERIKFLINLDMVGSGSDGIKVVNGTVLEKQFALLKELNSKHKLLEMIGKRGSAANSDHYPFYAAGVPSFFIYTLGKESPEYHTIYDTPDNVPFTEYEDMFNLLTLFVGKM